MKTIIFKKSLLLSLSFFLCSFLFSQTCSLSVNSVSGPTDNGDGTCTYDISVTPTISSNDNGNNSNSVTFSSTNGTITSQTVFTGCDPCGDGIVTYDLTVEATCGASVSIVFDFNGPGSNDCTSAPLVVPTTSLPVDFGDIELTILNNRVHMSWETLFELNNLGFDIERSLDGKHFEKIGFVASRSTADYGNQYKFIDTDAITSSVLYYRLKQVDYNGDYKYSEVVSINTVSKLNQGSIYPNPITSGYPLTISDLAKSKYSLMHSNGAIILKGELSSDYETIDFQNLKAGLYFFEVQREGKQVLMEKLLVY